MALTRRETKQTRHLTMDETSELRGSDSRLPWWFQIRAFAFQVIIQSA